MPKWVLALFLRINFSGRVVWQLWHLMFVSKASGYEVSSALLRTLHQYTNLLYQQTRANQTTQLGPTAHMWLPWKLLAASLPG